MPQFKRSPFTAMETQPETREGNVRAGDYKVNYTQHHPHKITDLLNRAPSLKQPPHTHTHTQQEWKRNHHTRQALEIKLET